MAEFEFAGMTFKGGKMMIVITALSTLAGGAWGAFEVYADYMDMKEIIQNIDTNAIASRNAIIETKLEEAIDYTRDIKQGLKDDIIRMEKVTDSTDRRVKDIQQNIDTSLREMSNISRESEKDVRDTMRTTEDRIDSKMEKLDASLRSILQEALNNPLTK
jgi:molecular chaperone DnaK (HSP70)